MNNGSKTVLKVILGLIVVVLAIWWYVGRDERAIKKVIIEIAGYASSEAGKGDIANALASQNLSERFTEGANIKWSWPEWPKIKTGEGSLIGRDKIRDSALIAKRSGEVRFEIENLEVAASGAQGEANASVLVHFSSGDLATFNTSFSLTKSNRWQISEITARPVKNSDLSN